MTIRALQESFAAWRDAGQPLVLATVYDTRGSTYSKAGARMLIARDAHFQGMLSGGCLEGDLAERAMAVLETDEPQTVTYDLGQNEDELWGLGVGCDGLMRIFLQPLRPEAGYQPFAAISDILAGDLPGVAATVIASEHPSLAPGATLVVGAGEARSFGVPAPIQDILARRCADAAAGQRSFPDDLEVDGHPVLILVARLQPPPRILILGGGLDAEPVVRLAAELGWRVTLQDHRPAYIERGDFSLAERVLSVPAAELAASVELDRFDAVIVMSHHLATDRVYLAQLVNAGADSGIPYIGLLGPPDRRTRLMEELGEDAARLEERLQGPAGFDIGADGPASIALSILAEMHACLKGPHAARAPEAIGGRT